MNLWPGIRDQAVERRTITVWWLYQAGFAVKSSDGTILLIDPYLSDAVLRSYRQPRAEPAPFAATDASVHAVLVTHSHDDHLDPDSVSAFAENQSTRFVGPRSAMQKATSLGADRDQTVTLAHGDTVSVGQFRVMAVTARHDVDIEPTPDAIGFLLESDGVRIYHSGDTEYDRRIIEETRDVDAALVCINGTGGNMNVHEAALLTWQQNARAVAPMHHRLWAEGGFGAGATLDPSDFVATYTTLGGTGIIHLPEVGVPFTIGRAE